jgi:hypothetical protein
LDEPSPKRQCHPKKQLIPIEDQRLPTAGTRSQETSPHNSHGAVFFHDGGTLLSTAAVNAGGRASYTTSSLSADTHTIIATSAEGANYRLWLKQREHRTYAVDGWSYNSVKDIGLPLSQAGRCFRAFAIQLAQEMRETLDYGFGTLLMVFRMRETIW